MMGKRFSSRLVKKDRTYTYEEAAEVVGYTSGTVQSWRHKGLRVMMARKPHYILGEDLIDFLDAKKRKRIKEPSLETMRCFKCQAQRKPLGAKVDYVPRTDTQGQLMGLCSVCEQPLRQFESIEGLGKYDGIFDIVIRERTQA